MKEKCHVVACDLRDRNSLGLIEPNMLALFNFFSSMLGAKSSIASNIGLLILKNKLIYILLKFAILYLIILAGCWHTARVY